MNLWLYHLMHGRDSLHTCYSRNGFIFCNCAERKTFPPLQSPQSCFFTSYYTLISQAKGAFICLIALNHFEQKHNRLYAEKNICLWRCLQWKWCMQFQFYTLWNILLYYGKRVRKPEQCTNITSHLSTLSSSPSPGKKYFISLTGSGGIFIIYFDFWFLLWCKNMLWIYIPTQQNKSLESYRNRREEISINQFTLPLDKISEKTGSYELNYKTKNWINAWKLCNNGKASIQMKLFIR